MPTFRWTPHRLRMADVQRTCRNPRPARAAAPPPRPPWALPACPLSAPANTGATLTARRRTRAAPRARTGPSHGRARCRIPRATAIRRDVPPRSALPRTGALARATPHAPIRKDGAAARGAKTMVGGWVTNGSASPGRAPSGLSGAASLARQRVHAGRDGVRLRAPVLCAREPRSGARLPERSVEERGRRLRVRDHGVRDVRRVGLALEALHEGRLREDVQLSGVAQVERVPEEVVVRIKREPALALFRLLDPSRRTVGAHEVISIEEVPQVE